MTNSTFSELTLKTLKGDDANKNSNSGEFVALLEIDSVYVMK